MATTSKSPERTQAQPEHGLGEKDLKDVCNLLCKVLDKVYKIGVQLGIPTHKLDEFKKEDDTLEKTIDYWLKGNVKDVVPVTWESIEEALRSNHVNEIGLAEEVCNQFCRDCTEESTTEKKPEVSKGNGGQEADSSMLIAGDTALIRSVRPFNGESLVNNVASPSDESFGLLNKVDPVQENTQKDSLKAGSYEVKTKSGKELIKQELSERDLIKKMLEKEMKTRQDREIAAIDKEIAKKKYEKKLLENEHKRKMQLIEYESQLIKKDIEIKEKEHEKDLIKNRHDHEKQVMEINKMWNKAD